MFDLNISKILVLCVLGLLIFGPDQLPKMAAQAGQALRELRRIAEKARADLSENLGPEFAEFDFNDLNPKTFVRKHLLDDLGDDSFGWDGQSESTQNGSAVEAVHAAERLGRGEVPPYDTEAT